MTFNEWVASKPGRLTELAATFSISQSAVSQWLNNGVPKTRMLAIRDLSAGAVTLEEMLAQALEHARLKAH
jgi:DNA-binding transcriptional regulator YdaS (Cro superfamily)